MRPSRCASGGQDGAGLPSDGWPSGWCSVVTYWTIGPICRCPSPALTRTRRSQHPAGPDASPDKGEMPGQVAAGPTQRTYPEHGRAWLCT